MLRPPPLRTVRASCPAHGSSLCRLIPDLLMVPMMTPPMQEAQVSRVVPAALVARLDVMPVHHTDVLIRVEWDAAFGTGVALGAQEFLSSPGEGLGLQSLPPPLVPIKLGIRVQGTGAPLDLRVADPSVPMMMRHRLPGSLDLRA